MAGQENWFRDLYYETWSAPNPSENPSVMIFFHGVHESADTMTAHRLSAAFLAKNISFCCLESHAHGHSVRHHQLGAVESWDRLITDATQFIDYLINPASTESADNNAVFRDASFFISGHSMGGAMAALLGNQLQAKYGNRFRGAVLIAPALAANFTSVPGLVRALTSGMKSIGLGNLGIGDVEDTSIYDTGSNKHLNYNGRMKATTVNMFMGLFQKVAAEIKAGQLDFRYPFAIAHGTTDELVPFAIGEQMISISSSPDKTMIAIPNASHQPLIEPSAEDTAQKCANWCSERRA
eukprot:c7110_g1_i1.p1 GENE.c7110_g1_i1~~c7110_g1_i1.p1  ORF type:complete len:310 (-),score=56.59 c7110_g1_i1:63-947(-)